MPKIILTAEEESIAVNIIVKWGTKSPEQNIKDARKRINDWCEKHATKEELMDKIRKQNEKIQVMRDTIQTFNNARKSFADYSTRIRARGDATNADAIDFLLTIAPEQLPKNMFVIKEVAQSLARVKCIIDITNGTKITQQKLRQSQQKLRQSLLDLSTMIQNIGCEQISVKEFKGKLKPVIEQLEKVEPTQFIEKSILSCLKIYLNSDSSKDLSDEESITVLGVILQDFFRFERVSNSSDSSATTEAPAEKKLKDDTVVQSTRKRKNIFLIPTNIQDFDRFHGCTRMRLSDDNKSDQ